MPPLGPIFYIAIQDLKDFKPPAFQKSVDVAHRNGLQAAEFRRQFLAEKKINQIDGSRLTGFFLHQSDPFGKRHAPEFIKFGGDIVQNQRVNFGKNMADGGPAALEQFVKIARTAPQGA